MTNDELNKRVHEIMGLKYYYNFTGNWQTSAYEFGMMFEFMQKHERWEEFVPFTWHWYRETIIETKPWLNVIHVRLISPRPFAEAMVSFFEASHD